MVPYFFLRRDNNLEMLGSWNFQWPGKVESINLVEQLGSWISSFLICRKCWSVSKLRWKKEMLGPGHPWAMILFSSWREWNKLMWTKEPPRIVVYNLQKRIWLCQVRQKRTSCHAKCGSGVHLAPEKSRPHLNQRHHLASWDCWPLPLHRNQDPERWNSHWYYRPCQQRTSRRTSSHPLSGHPSYEVSIQDPVAKTRLHKRWCTPHKYKERRDRISGFDIFFLVLDPH